MHAALLECVRSTRRGQLHPHPFAERGDGHPVDARKYVPHIASGARLRVLQNFFPARVTLTQLLLGRAQK